MLNAFALLKCSKKCQHNVQKPSLNMLTAKGHHMSSVRNPPMVIFNEQHSKPLVMFCVLISDILPLNENCFS